MADPRDDAVSRRYRELAPEEPPRALDEAILAASRRAVGARPGTPPLSTWAPAGRRWYVPLAAAAVLVLSVGVTLHMQIERPGIDKDAKEAAQAVTPPSPKVLDAPPPKEAAPPPAAEPKAMAAAPAGEKAQAADSTAEHFRLRADSARQAEASRSRELASVARSQAERRESPQPFRLESPAREAPASAPPMAGSRVAESVRAPVAAQGGAQNYQLRDDASHDKAESSRSIASGMIAKRAMDETPEKQLERIAELRRTGKHEEADRALAEFRKRFPDYRISDEMKAKVERR